jgi:hypothetical protein
MKVTIEPVLEELLSVLIDPDMSDRQSEIINLCQRLSAQVYLGYIDNRLIACWGLVPPTVFSGYAYLWMYTTPLVREHQFTFVRRSQIIIKDMLKSYPTIVGHCVADATDSIRWLRWLGASFEMPIGNLVPFTIRRREDG